MVLEKAFLNIDLPLQPMSKHSNIFFQLASRLSCKESEVHVTFRPFCFAIFELLMITEVDYINVQGEDEERKACKQYLMFSVIQFG